MEEILKRLRELHEAAKAESRSFTEAEQKEWDELTAKREDLIQQEKREADLTEQEARAAKPEKRQAPPEAAEAPEAREEERVVPASVPRYGRLKNFDDDYAAYRFGQWFLAAAGNQNAARWCDDQGVELRAATEGVNTQGGYAVPDEFDTVLVDLREQYGVFRRNARVVPMSSDVKVRPKRESGLTPYFVGEYEGGPESTKAWSQIQLVAKKLMVLTAYTNELNEDAVLNIGDDIAGEIAWAFAKKEDECGFVGTGAGSTYGGIKGVIPSLSAISSAAGVKSATSGSSTDWSKVTLRDLEQLVGVLPQYAETNMAKWYCSKSFFANVLQALAYAAGGNTTENIGGRAMRTFLGYPVEITQTMPTAADSAEIVCLFGDLTLAADFGDRRQNTIAISTDATIGDVSVFERDAVAVRGTSRFDINVHSLGDGTDAGPIVALKTAS